jgi:hypothetical protein|tara:strand:+ start:954 stop:1766 length:813 start_codon:yes stop_codon:yes gene_type:complete
VDPVKKQFKSDYNNYILPYNKEVGISDAKNKAKSYKEWQGTFIHKKVELMEYNDLSWVNTHKYARDKWGDTFQTHLGDTTIDLLKALNTPKTARRASQVLNLCCDLYKNPPKMYPVHIHPERVHPGNTLLYALKILEKSVRVIRISPLDYTDDVRVITRFNNIADIQKIYNKKIYAFFIGKEKWGGLQILAEHDGFTGFDQSGNLQWGTDNEPWPIDMFLDKIAKDSKRHTGEVISITTDQTTHSIVFPNDTLAAKKLFIETIKWGSENI